MRFRPGWKTWAVLAIAVFACGVFLPGLILDLVVFPAAGRGKPGLRVDYFSHTRQGGGQTAERNLPGRAELPLEPGAKSFRAYGVMRLDKGGPLGISLECPQSARVYLNQGLAASVGGINRPGKSRGTARLGAGPALVVLEANAGAFLRIKPPGSGTFESLGRFSIASPELGNLSQWWFILRSLALAPYLALAFGILALWSFLFSENRQADMMRLARPGFIALVLGLFLFFFYFAGASGHFHSFDDILRYKTTESLARGGGLAIDAYGHGKPAPIKYGPVQPVVSVPLFRLGEALQGIWPGEPKLTEVAVSSLMQAVTALCGAALFGLMMNLGYGPAASVCTALLFGLATMAWPYARYHFTEPLSCLFIITAWWLILAARRGRAVLRLGLAGACLGLGGLNHLNLFILACPLFFVYAVWLFRPGVGRSTWRIGQFATRMAALALPMALGVLAYLAFNYLRFGSPWVSGYEIDRAAPNLVYDGCNGFCNPWWVGVQGLLFSPGKSAFLYSPLLFLSVFLIRPFYKNHRAEAVLLGGLWLAWLGFYATWWAWHGDFCWGPRYLLPVMGLACLPLAEAWPRLKAPGKAFTVAFILLTGLAVLVQALAVCLPFSFYLTSLVPNDLGNIYLVHYIPHLSPIPGQLKMLHIADHLDFYWLERPALPWLALAVFFLGSLLWRQVKLARKN